MYRLSRDKWAMMANTIRTSGFKALVQALVDGRHALGITQRDLAARLGCLPATVANIESGQRRIDVIELIALARALSMSPDELFQIAMREADESELINNFSRSRHKATDPAD
jgi:transcriptional regulator with XRE-family HTH domain